MICDRCGEITETFVTEQHGELCEACQRLVEGKNSYRDRWAGRGPAARKDDQFTL